MSARDHTPAGYRFAVQIPERMKRSEALAYAAKITHRPAETIYLAPGHYTWDYHKNGPVGYRLVDYGWMCFVPKALDTAETAE